MRFRLPPPSRFAGHPPYPFWPNGNFPLTGGIGPRKGGGYGADFMKTAKKWLHPCGGAVSRRLTEGVKLLCALSLLLPLTACGPKTLEQSTTIFAMDTVMNLTVYYPGENGAQAFFQEKVNDIYEFEAAFSTTRAGSDIHTVNANCGKEVELSPDTADLLDQALALCEKTDGALDVTTYPAVKAWGFTTGEYRVVGEQERSELSSRIDYSAVELDGNTVAIPEGMELDLGAVAKGYVGDRLTWKCRDGGVTSALLDLGQSTIAAVGGKPDGSPWRIGIQDPHGDSYLGVLELRDQSMGSSGNYQRYFEENGIKYGHILDPETAAPADSGLAGVTVVADSALLCDGLSTALFVMGLEEAGEYWQENRDFEAIFIEENGNITITAGMQANFRLQVDQQHREVTVLE